MATFHSVATPAFITFVTNPQSYGWPVQTPHMPEAALFAAVAIPFLLTCLSWLHYGPHPEDEFCRWKVLEILHLFLSPPRGSPSVRILHPYLPLPQSSYSPEEDSPSSVVCTFFFPMLNPSISSITNQEVTNAVQTCGKYFLGQESRNVTS